MFSAAIAYLLIPTVIFLIGFSAWPTALLVVIGAGASIYLLRRGNAVEPIEPGPRNWLPFLFAAVAVTFLAGILPPLGQHSDWPKHYALFNMMTDQTWPPRAEIDGETYSLRYPLSWYVVPSLIGKLLGKWAVPYAAFVWTAAGLFLALRISFRDIANARAQVLACLVFLMFSGADILGYAVTQFRVGPIFHIEWWAGFAESPSNMTSLSWTPQHAIPAWIATALFLRYPEKSVRNCMVIAASLAGWSPFVLIGMAPIVILAIARTGFKQALTPQNISALLIFVPVFLFLSRGTDGLPATAGWSDQFFTLPKFLLFLILEFWLIGALVIWANRSTTVPVITCVAFLTALSLTRVGLYNDLMMRGGIPALGLLAILSAETVVRKRLASTWPLLIVLAIGAIVPLGEMARGFVEDRIPSPEQITIEHGAFPNPMLYNQYLAKTQ